MGYSDIKEIISDFTENFYNKGTLFGGLILIVIGAFSLLNIFPASNVTILFSGCIIVLFFIGTWFYRRSNFPRGSKGKESLIIAITTENSKQKQRIKYDLKKEIVRQLSNHNLHSNYSVIVLDNYQAELVKKEIEENLEQGKDGTKVLPKVYKKMQAKFIIYGDLITRNGSNSTYHFDIKALVFHAPIVNPVGKKNIHLEFNRLWKNEISFLEEDELNGFKNNANNLFFVAAYMLGIATFVDNRFESGILIWENLENYIKDKKDLQKFKDKIFKFKHSAYVLQSKLEYLQGNIKRAMQLKNKYLLQNPNSYAKNLAESINCVQEGLTSRALEHIEKAKVLAGKDGTWRYNKFFVLVLDRQDDVALEILEEISGSSYPDEKDTIKQVLAYNKSKLRENSSTFYYSNFILGFLYYKKLKDPINAYEYLKTFVDESEIYSQYPFLKVRALIYIAEIDNLLEVKSSAS